jgi:hypothetical protein
VPLILSRISLVAWGIKKCPITCHYQIFDENQNPANTIVILFVRPDIDTWFVRLSPPTVLELQL